MEGGNSQWDGKDQFENLSVSEIIQQLDERPIEAAYALGSLGTTDAVQPLIMKLVFPPDDTVWDNLNNLAIAWALGKIRDRMAVPPLIRLLESRFDDVRTISAWALGQIGDKAAIPALVEALKTEEHNVQWKKNPSVCNDLESDNPTIKTIIPYIVSTCLVSENDSPFKKALTELGYFNETVDKTTL